MTDLVIKQNGIIKIYQAFVLFRTVQPVLSYRVIDDDRIELEQITGVPFTLFASNIKSITLFGQPKAAFDGDAQDLATILNDSIIKTL